MIVLMWRYISGLIPQENWQQAGLLLLEDTAYLGKSLRLSLAFNNFFGGFDQTDEILVQGVADFGKSSPNIKEVQHHPLFSMQEADSAIVRNNLQFSALRVENGEAAFAFCMPPPLRAFFLQRTGGVRV